MPFTTYRTQFPFTVDKIYLNHAAVSPISNYVREKMDWFINNRGFGEIEFYDEISEIRSQTREMIGQLINAPKESIAFTTNTSEGFNWLAHGLTWKRGDQIILADNEFPANVYPFMNLKKYGVEIVFVKSKKSFVSVDALEAAITPRTKLISISFVDFFSGYKNDLLAIGALCKKHNILFSVDAIQGLGVIPLDVKSCHIDFLSCAAHKWLMAPMGSAFMYIGPELFEKLEPVFAGWMGVTNALDFCNYNLEFRRDARRFEYGTQNNLGICGLSASLELLLKLGTAAIEQHLLILGKLLVDRLPEFGLKKIGTEDAFYWSGIYTFSSPDAEELFLYLKNNKVVCAVRSGCLRFAPHFYNSRDEIIEVVELVADWYRTHPNVD